jgi:spermidine synthase
MDFFRAAHRLLRPEGHLAFWSALHAFPADFDPFFSEIQEVYDAIGAALTVLATSGVAAFAAYSLNATRRRADSRRRTSRSHR